MSDESRVEKLVRRGIAMTMGFPGPDPSTLTDEELEVWESLHLDIERMKSQGIMPDFPD